METLIALPAIYWALIAVGILVGVWAFKMIWALIQTAFKALVLIMAICLVVLVCWLGFRVADSVFHVKKEVAGFVSPSTDLLSKFNK